MLVRRSLAALAVALMPLGAPSGSPARSPALAARPGHPSAAAADLRSAAASPVAFRDSRGVLGNDGAAAGRDSGAEPGGITGVAGFGWPLRPAPDRVVRDFDPPAEPWLAGNRGVDLAGRAGQAVHAAGPGVVTFAGVIAHVGVVSVTSGALRTTYEPLAVTAHRGQQVAAGAVLGHLTLAGSHCLPAVCLHWGLLRGVAYLDPLALLGLEQVRLLPLTPSP